MSYTLILTPAGRLLLRESDGGETFLPDAWMRRVIDAFSSNMSAGLFALAATRSDTPPPPAFSFWRNFAGSYLTELCRMPVFAGAQLDPIAPHSPEEMGTLLHGAPPMEGGEYLNADVLQAFWKELDEWVRDQVFASGVSLEAWLKKNAPIWQQVGRVSFHLAENKSNPAFPFAFLATYAPRLSGSGRVQYQPLNLALREYAGERNRGALLKLLSPVQLASEKSEFIRELIDSKDLFHPLAWTPAEAFQFLQDVPLFEESGILVRLPDWWRARPRPRVSVSIGEKKQSRFGAAMMLDFETTN